MPRYLLLRSLLAVLAGAALTSQVRAQCGSCDPSRQSGLGGMPIKVDCKFQFNVKFGPAPSTRTKLPGTPTFPLVPAWTT